MIYCCSNLTNIIKDDSNLYMSVPIGIIMGFLSLITIIGNSMVLHAIRTERRLQTVSNMFIMSLAVADLTVGGIVMPISSIYAITGHWTLGLAICQFWLSADYTASTASILNLFILSLDRYWSVTSPLRYLQKRTKKRALIMIGLAWLISALWILPIVTWHYFHPSGLRIHPNNVCETEFNGNREFKTTAAIFNFYIPTILMIYLYVRIFYEIKKRSKFEIGQCNHSRKAIDSIVLASKQFDNLTIISFGKRFDFEGVTVNVEYISTKRNSNSMVLQKEKKAARQLGVIMGAFILCWLPYFILFMVIAFCSECVNTYLHTATIWLGYINSTLNPILYPLCNASFKRAFRRMLHCKT